MFNHVSMHLLFKKMYSAIKLSIYVYTYKHVQLFIYLDLPCDIGVQRSGFQPLQLLIVFRICKNMQESTWTKSDTKTETIFILLKKQAECSYTNNLTSFIEVQINKSEVKPASYATKLQHKVSL